MATLGKPQRQHRILRVLEEQPVSSQTQLVQLLEAEGVVATQATVSRDLEELGAVKVRIPGGAMAYAIPEHSNERSSGGDDHMRSPVFWVVATMRPAWPTANTVPPSMAGRAVSLMAAIDEPVRVRDSDSDHAGLPSDTRRATKSPLG